MVFSPKEVPKEETLRELASKFPQVEFGVIDAMLKLLRFNSELDRAMESHFAKYNLSGARFTTLMMLFSNAKTGLNPSELADKLGVTRGNMTGLIDGLEKANLIFRQNDPNDRRLTFIRMSDQGLRLLEKILPDHYQCYSDFIGSISIEQRTLLNESLESLRKGLSKLVGTSLK